MKRPLGGPQGPVRPAGPGFRPAGPGFRTKRDDKEENVNDEIYDEPNEGEGEDYKTRDIKQNDISGSLNTLWARVKIREKNQCREKIREKSKPFVSHITDKHICAGNSDGIDACGADSGGPLICMIGESAVIAGIVSFGIGCGGSERIPGVYTHVAKYLPWIKSNMVRNIQKLSNTNLSNT